ncbi:hypothetical protein ABUU18_24145 [Escherichia coli]|uniref:hypothetical protein n=1 Tax=Escherichia coli TaxID=562 RepID=UPI00334FE966
MINNKLIEIDNCLSTPSFFDFLKSLNVDSALDSRDEPEFDDCWMSEFNSLDKESFQDDDIEFIDSLREKAFKYSFWVINNSEISSRISDDIEIISKSFVLGKENSWSITHLWSSYKNRKFPE